MRPRSWASNIQTLDGQNQVPKQTADVEAAIAKKVSGILISPITADGMAPAVKEAVDAGIPVVTVDRTVYDVDTLAHVGADNVLGGEQQGKALLALFPKGATIFELTGTPGATPAIDRSKGLHNIIDSHPEIKVACQQTGEFDRDKGLTRHRELPRRHPQPGRHHRRQRRHGPRRGRSPQGRRPDRQGQGHRLRRPARGPQGWSRAASSTAPSSSSPASSPAPACAPSTTS